jgi:ferredoxin
MSKPVTRKLMLFFPTCECEKPIIYHLVKDFDLIVNVFRAKVTPKEEGYLVLDVTGALDAIERAVDYLRTFDITINDSGKGLTWDAARCCHCGHCVPFCPTSALTIPDAATREVTFDSAACIECLACVRVCPYNACVSTF